jgi:hypothetical protein
MRLSSRSAAACVERRRYCQIAQPGRSVLRTRPVCSAWVAHAGSPLACCGSPSAQTSGSSRPGGIDVSAERTRCVDVVLVGWPETERCRLLHCLAGRRGCERRLPVPRIYGQDDLFIFTGAVPHTHWLENSLALDAHGFLLTGPNLPTEGPFLWRLDRPAALLGDLHARGVRCGRHSPRVVEAGLGCRRRWRHGSHAGQELPGPVRKRQWLALEARLGESLVTGLL